jgi:hypothetical protein
MTFPLTVKKDTNETYKYQVNNGGMDTLTT